MPDKDIFDRNLAKGWRNVARSAHCGFDPKDVAHRAAVALRRDLRASCGFPGWEELYDILAVSGKGNEEDALKVFDKAKSFERATDDRDLAGVLTKTFLQIYITIMDSQNHGDGKIRFDLLSKKEFVKKLCTKFLDYRLHSKIDMIERSGQERGYWSGPEYNQAYFQELNPYLEIIAETLVRDPGFAKPPTFHRYHRVRRTTEELMHIPIELQD
ncbi:hypothetical protein KJ068_24455 [bacterium]|nr:hypothetical protein [bacterium]